MTTALYRRYRPESFAEVIGQEQVTGPLSVALNKNRVNHAYLFSGPRGCGKTTSARILARCLNCEQGPTSTPCGVCPSCVDLARGGPGSLDVVEIDAASHGGVDDARDLRERAAFAPVRDRYKVFIIDEAHMVSPQGFNALLKIVEEPPEHIRFIFATTEPEKVIGTIRSRTHHYPFRLVPPERLTQYLAELCEREDVQVGKGVLPLVVRAGTGSVRDTLSVLDQLIGGSGEEGLTYATAIGLLGYTDSTLLDDVADALAAGDGATVFRVVDRVIESGHDPRRFVEDLLERLRDLLVVAAVRDGGHAVFRGMPDDQLERLRNQAARFGAAELSRAADVANAALTEMTGATSPRLQLELLCARLLLPGADDEQRGLGARVDRLERRISSGLAPAAGTAATVPAVPAVAPAGPAPVVADPASPQGRSSGLAAVRAAIGRPNGTGTAPSTGAEAGSGQVGESSLKTSVGPGPEGSGLIPSAAPAPVEATPPPAPAAAAPHSAPPAPQSAPAAQPAPSAPAAQAGGGDLEAVRHNWTGVLDAVRSIKLSTWALVSPNAQVLDYDGRRLLLGFSSAGLLQTFGRGPHANFMRQAVHEVIGLECVVEAMVTSEFRGGGGGDARPSNPPGPPAPPGGPSAAPAAAPSVAPAVATPMASAASTQPTAPVASHPAPQPRAASTGGWAERPSNPTAPQASAWSEVSQNPAAQPTQPVAGTGSETSSGGVGVATRPAPPAATPAPTAPAAPAAAPTPQQKPPAAQPRSGGAAAARAAAAAAAARAQNQNGRAPGAAPAENRSGRNTGPEEDRGMPTPQATPYDDIPPDLNEPMREDEAPPDAGWSTPQSRRPQPKEAAEPDRRPKGRVVDLANDIVSADDADFDASPLVGVQAVEQLLGGRVIEEREL
ncbi:DNA polymerase III subunit gamma and tau [Kineosporia rhizophila]|uniref:DNA polymerase III subunit gamma and tau n=1 Tax=Kineosporia rhizophila TaxID=84633 RepID=UPI001E2DF789|nr:DNA polymerase III subunit gamma and tau [Kineosporia rhizophila]